MIKDKVLVLDDEVDVCNVLREYLSFNNYNVKCCTSVDDFLVNLKDFEPQFLIMDKQVQQSNTYTLINEIRNSNEQKDIPIIVVTGANDQDEQEKAVDIGADDIVFKPLRCSELRAKLKSLGRRSNMYFDGGSSIQFKGISLFTFSNEVFIGDRKIELTTTEYKILKALLMYKGNVVSREQLNQKALTMRNNSPRTIDVHITSLRNKLGHFGSNIRTLRGRGYLLV